MSNSDPDASNRRGRCKMLCVAPHPDDVEGGMGGSILKWTEQGHEVHICDLTTGEPTPHGSPETRRKETGLASDLMGIASRNCLELPNRYLFDTKENRIKLAEVIRTVRPDVLFLPYWVDAHPDHIQATQLGEAARFYAKLSKVDWRGEPWYPSRILYYLAAHLRCYPDPAFVMDITDVFEKKLEICKAYRSQFAYNEDRWREIGGVITSYCSYFGSLIRRDYGEAFCSRELIGIDNLDGLILN